MEETQNQPQESFQETPQPQENRVSFPTVGEQKKNGGAKTLLIIGILILIGVLGYVIYKSASGKNNQNTLTEPTPFVNSAAPEVTPSPATSPTSSPSATVDKTKIKIQVQNGTGITGEAAYLQTILNGLGYTNVAVGNSATQNLTDAEVSFSSTLSTTVVNEITTKLNSIYQSVTKENATSTTYDVVIVTGLRKGATPKPTTTPTVSPTPTVKPSATPTAIPQ